MYLWIGLGLEQSDETYIRDYCKNINKDFNVNEQAFTLPQHISLKTSFYTDYYLKIIKDLKTYFSKNKKMYLEIKNVEFIPGIIWLTIEERSELRYYHNVIIEYLERYNIGKVGFDGNQFKFHSTLFQDVDNLEQVKELYRNIDKLHFINRKIIADKIYFGISEIGKVGTYKVIDSIDLKD